MYHYIYKTTNMINQKFYIGRRSSDMHPDEDPYLGSGKRLKSAIKKYGRDNFTKEIIAIVENYDTLVETEKIIVCEQLILDKMCYNLAIGGHGGYTSYENRVFTHTEEAKEKIGKANKGRPRPDVRSRALGNQYSKGLVRSDEDRMKKSTAALNRLATCQTDFNTIIVCPHCGKEGQSANMRRWHFDKCKRNDI